MWTEEVGWSFAGVGGGHDNNGGPSHSFEFAGGQVHPVPSCTASPAAPSPINPNPNPNPNPSPGTGAGPVAGGEACGPFAMHDAYGDGWNGAEANWVGSGAMTPAPFTLQHGHQGETQVCGQGCFTLHVVGGMWTEEVGWSFAGV